MSRIGGVYGLAVLLALAGGAAGAEKAAAPVQAPVGSEPGATTASYGDWIVRCSNATVAGAQKYICEAVQTMQIQGQQAPAAQVAFGKVDGTGPLHLVIALPVNVIFPSSVKVGVDDKDPHPLELVWKRCLPGACFADVLAAPDVVGRWRVATTPGRILFTDAGGRDMALPLSFRGMGPAIDALQKGQ